MSLIEYIFLLTWSKTYVCVGKVSPGYNCSPATFVFALAEFRVCVINYISTPQTEVGNVGKSLSLYYDILPLSHIFF